MTDKELRKLRKNELLGIMLAQSREIDVLREKVAELEQALESREIRISEAGSLAEAALGLTRIFEEAQKAADLYVYNRMQQVQETAVPEESLEAEAKEFREEAEAEFREGSYADN